MKNRYTKIVLLVLLSLLFSHSFVFAQVPQAINFQAIARDGSGNPMVNTNIQIRLSVIDSAQAGTIVYQELRALQTNAYGSFSFQIGVNPSFTTIGSFPAINWVTGNKHLKIDYDPTNTFTFNLTLGVIKFVTVPYAFTAETVAFIDATGAQDGDILIFNSSSGKFEPGQVNINETDPIFSSWDKDYTDLINKPSLFDGTWSSLTGKPNFATVATSGSYTDLNNKPITDGSETKLIAGTDIIITGAGTLTSPYTINSSNTNLNYIGGSGIIITGNTISAIDTSFSNELQTLSISNDTIYLSNGGFVKLPSNSNILSPPEIISVDTSDVFSFSATINAIINPKGLSTIVSPEWGFIYSYENTIVVLQSPITGTFNIPLSVSLNNLRSNTTYHYRIKASNAVDVSYSNDFSFKTPPSSPLLTTLEINSITGISAISGGNITYDGGGIVFSRGVCWSTNPSPTILDNNSSNGSGTGEYISNITSLNLGVTYYVRAYAENIHGISYGNELTFTTIALPIVTTSNFNDIRGISAKVGGSIVNNGGAVITSQGLCWSTSQNPTTANSTNSNFTEMMTNLTPNTVYYVRAYATNLSGTGYGNQISFNSGKVIGSTFGGGLVFYNDGTGHGLVCADSDQAIEVIWGCTDTINNTTLVGTSTTLNTGTANTNAIVSSCSTANIAARICFDLVLNSYSDWFLPSKDELYLMYLNLDVQGLGNFTLTAYWSSSELDANNAWLQLFRNLVANYDNPSKQVAWVKNLSRVENTNYTFRVRAVRAF